MKQPELKHLHSGKVREVYEVDADHLLLVASDRLSAFDVVMGEEIPDKGRVLTALTHFWLAEAGIEVPSALVSCDPAGIDEVVPGFADYEPWHGRAMLMRSAKMVPLEVIVRARLAGHAYEEYQESGTVGGVAAPEGMALTDPFDEPLVCFSTKAESGHDVYLDREGAARLAGAPAIEGCEEICRRLFNAAAAKMAQVGLVLADSKFELGWINDRLLVCDEVVTPDSSRIWPADQITRGHNPPSFDKQPFRDWVDAQGWDHTPPPPTVPPDVVAETARRYVECYERVTGRRLSDWYGRAR